MLVDTHAHLNFPELKKGLGGVIRRARENGVGKIICVSSNLQESQAAIEISQKYPGVVYPAIGLHPHQTDPDETDSPETQIRKLARLAESKEIVGIGECGLDFSPAPPNEKDRSKQEQIYLFQEQIKLALNFKKPILIHCREAFRETIEIIKSIPYRSPSTAYRQLLGVFHCYSAGKKGIEKINQLGLYFGVDGRITYDEGIQNVAKQISLENILLETDSPWLTPKPFREQKNEPANIKIIAECLAKVKSVSFEKVARITTKNANKLFGV